ncbi:MAG: hypothetical protein HN353_02700 [Bdellovibrionales bacterium]|jgi:hypothetical protein|nr:hypothetical protein [Bdellovibrionales bacterium]MBT3525596.1 hypothetical protein [Bdellovibrionales bacterium]
MAFKKLYEELILELRNINKDKYFLIPKKELQSIDFIMGGSPRDYIGIQRRVGSHSTLIIKIGSVHSFFGNIPQVRIERSMHFKDFQKNPNAHDFEYKDGIFNVYSKALGLSNVAKKIDCEINNYEIQSTLKFTPSYALAKIVGLAPLDNLSMWDLFSNYVISKNLVTSNKHIRLDKNLMDIFGPNCKADIKPEQVKEILKEHLEEIPPF